MSIRIVIGEDQALLRQGIVRLLGDAGFEVVAEAGDAPDLLRKVAAHEPDVAIVDVQMPPDNTDDGLRAALEIRAPTRDIGVLVLSQYAEERYAVDLIGDNAEGVGYLLKDRVTDFKLFADAVRRVAAGGSVLDPTVVAHMLGRRRRDDPLDGADAARARGARADGRGALEQGHRRGARRHAARGREARDEHLHQARRRDRRRGPSPRARGAALHPRGIRALMSVPAPGGLSTSSVPSSAPTRSSSPRSPLPPAASAPPTPSSRTSTTRAAVLAPHVDARVGRLRVLGDVGQRLGDDEVGRGLDRAREPLARARESSSTGIGARLASDSSAASSPRWESTAGWMPDARSRSSSTAPCALANALSTSPRAAPGPP